MSNKRFSDVNPARGEKDSAKEAIKSDSKTKPTGNPSFDGPAHLRGGAPSGNGGKDLPSPAFEEKKHRKPTGDLP